MKTSAMSIRGLFRIAIVVVAVFAFLFVLVISFLSVSAGEFERAENRMRSEVNYLCLQMDAMDARAADLVKFADSTGNDPEKLQEDYPTLFGEHSDSAKELIKGYTLEETGTVFVMVDGMVAASDDPKVPVGSNVRELFGDEVYASIDISCKTDEMQHIMNRCASAGAGQYGGSDAYLLAWERNGRIVVIIESTNMIYRDRTSVLVGICGVALLVLVLVLFIVDRLLSRMVARRVDGMNDALGRIMNGDTNMRLEEAGTREFKLLSSDINRTVDALQGLISEAEERMDAELETARTIQLSTLPKIFPPYPDIRRFDIYASMEPARQVGGDFYDFFLIDEGANSESKKLGFVVADVSGKGVPAALFMMKAKTQIRDYLQSGAEVGEAVDEANRQICEGNDAGMFVTAWVGVLDYATGRIEYVNAGHNPPLVWQRHSGWRWLDERSGPMLGLFEGRPYKAHVLECSPEDELLLYTDGVTEAWDVAEELYGEERLLAVANKGYRLHPRELVEYVRADVAAYAEGAEQSDDITILALEYGVPPEVTATLEVPALISELNHVNDFLHAELERRLCPQRVQNQLDIAVEELFVNVCNYAYPDKTPDNPGRVRILRTYHAEPSSITVDIIDTGVPFNPLEKPDFTMPTNIMDIPIGGLGILLTKKVVNEIRYERLDHSNVITIVKKW